MRFLIADDSPMDRRVIARFGRFESLGSFRYTGSMQLRNARVCLDCEEVHDAQQCPTCASETFAFLTRWVPVPERRQRPRPAEVANREAVETYREMLSPQRPSSWSLIRRGALGLAIFGVAGWMWQRNTRPDTKSRGSGPAAGGNRGTGS